MSPTAFLFANGDAHSVQALGSLILPGDFLVAVDGGLYAMRGMGLQPHLLLGDLDSVSVADVAAAQESGCEVRRFPAEKDETDLELALGIVAACGYRQVRILAALGGRLDHMLGNLFLLTNPAWQDMDVRILDAGLEAFVIRRAARIQGQAGDTLSLLPMNGAAHGVRTEGLAYPLRGESLFTERTRGVSNRLLANEAAVSVEEGLLLCIHLRNQSKETPSSGIGGLK